MVETPFTTAFGDGPWRLEPIGDDRPSGTTACSRRGRGYTPRRRRRDGGSDDRLSVGGTGPRRRSARGDLRLDNGPEPWHNSSDRLGLSELETVTRVRRAVPGPYPRSEPAPTLPERRAGRQRRGRGRRRSPWTQRARPPGPWETAKNVVSRSAHSRELPLHQDQHEEIGARASAPTSVENLSVLDGGLTALLVPVSSVRPSGDIVGVQFHWPLPSPQGGRME